MSASIKDVAREAGVSIATVSRVLNNVDVVNDDTKKKVLEAISKLGYRPNIIARSLKTQKTSTIGIIIPDISNQFYPEIVRGAEDVANIYSYNIILCNTDLDSERELEYLRILKEKMIDGVLYMSNSLEEDVLKLINELKIPVVLIETKDKESNFPSITIDNEKAAYDATMFLISKGFKDIVFVGTHPNAENALSKRYLGYEKALKESGINVNPDLVCFSGIKPQDGANVVATFLKDKKFDAIFCISDELAMGVINELREQGLSVPEDVSVIGFDNIFSSSIYYPKLTTVSQPMYDMGSVGMRMLIKIINKQPMDNEHYVLPHEIIARNSTK